MATKKTTNNRDRLQASAQQLPVSAQSLKLYRSLAEKAFKSLPVRALKRRGPASPKKKYTRPRAVDLGLSPKKTPTLAQETGGKSKSSKVIAPTGRGKPITAGKAAMNIAKAIGKVATTRISDAEKALREPYRINFPDTSGRYITIPKGEVGHLIHKAVKEGAKALRPHTIFAKTKRATSRVKKIK